MIEGVRELGQVWAVRFKACCQVGLGGADLAQAGLASRDFHLGDRFPEFINCQLIWLGGLNLRSLPATKEDKAGRNEAKPTEVHIKYLSPNIGSISDGSVDAVTRSNRYSYLPVEIDHQLY